jgi:DNA-binding MarR family transcriptional regulator
LSPPKEWKDLTLSKKQSSKPPKTEALPRMPLSARPGYLVRRLHQIHSAIFLEECQGFAITPVQYGLISTLLAHPGADQVTLGGEVGIDRTNVADVLKRLSERGLVRRERSKTDGRSMVAFLTKEGERVAEEMYESMRRAQDRLLLPLRPEFRAAFLAMLTELIEGNSKYGLPDAGSDTKGNKGHLDD